jgi:hypothetical protein
MKKISIYLLSIIFIATSCQKEAEAPVCVLSSTSILGTYKTIAQTSQANPQSPVVDEYATWDACEKDDLNVFSSGVFLQQVKVFNLVHHQLILLQQTGLYQVIR